MKLTNAQKLAEAKRLLNEISANWNYAEIHEDDKTAHYNSREDFNRMLASLNEFHLKAPEDDLLLATKDAAIMIREMAQATGTEKQLFDSDRYHKIITAIGEADLRKIQKEK